RASEVRQSTSFPASLCLCLHPSGVKQLRIGGRAVADGPDSVEGRAVDIDPRYPVEIHERECELIPNEPIPGVGQEGVPVLLERFYRVGPYRAVLRAVTRLERRDNHAEMRLPPPLLYAKEADRERSKNPSEIAPRKAVAGFCSGNPMMLSIITSPRHTVAGPGFHGRHTTHNERMSPMAPSSQSICRYSL